MKPVKPRAHRLILLAMLGLMTTLIVPSITDAIAPIKSDLTPTSVTHRFQSSGYGWVGRSIWMDTLGSMFFNYRPNASPLQVPIVGVTNNPQSLLQQGIQFYEAEQFSPAITVWQQAAAAFASQGDTLNQSLTLSNLSLAYQHLGQWEAAQKAIDQSLKLLHNLEGTTNSQTYSEVFAKTLNTQGRLQWETGQLEQALGTWQRATVNYQEAENQTGIIGSLINQAKALQTLGLSSKAEEKLQTAYQILQQSDSPLKAKGFKDLGNALRRIGKLDQSQQILAKSLKFAQLPTAKGAVLLELGNTERALAQRADAIGKQPEALSHTQAAIAYFQQAFDTGGQIQASLNQLSLLVETEQWSEVAELLPQIQQSITSLPPSRTAIHARLN
ncbi:MAG: tetratricopeptide repeat protein, partial [Symploca sp. SIO3E6]|nr:tetratricopeptide repeat protein [Caldora sp. SIO3E6]